MKLGPKRKLITKARGQTAAHQGYSVDPWAARLGQLLQSVDGVRQRLNLR